MPQLPPSTRKRQARQLPALHDDAARRRQEHVPVVARAGDCFQLPTGAEASLYFGDGRGIGRVGG